MPTKAEKSQLFYIACEILSVYIDFPIACEILSVYIDFPFLGEKLYKFYNILKRTCESQNMLTLKRDG